MNNPTIRLDDRIVRHVKAKRLDPKLGEGSIVSIVSESIRLFACKHSNCFSCDAHKAVLAGIELAKQKSALGAENKGKRGSTWIGVHPDELKTAKRLAISYGGSSKAVVEQAVVEHITRPEACNQCPYYDKICKQAGLKNRRI